MQHQFKVPPALIESTRRACKSPQFEEALRLRELVGYLPGDRAAIVQSAPAILLRGLIVGKGGHALATIEPLATMEGQIVRVLAERLDPAEYTFVLHRAGYARTPEGMDFAIAGNVTRARLTRVLRDVFDDADDIAAALVSEPSRQPAPRPTATHRPVARRQPKRDDGMIGQGLIDRVRAMETEEQAEREAKQQAAEYARRTGAGDDSMSVARL